MGKKPPDGGGPAGAEDIYGRLKDYLPLFTQLRASLQK